MESEIIELSRCRDEESLAEIKAILDAANIPYRMSSTAANFDISSIGTGSNPEVIISVRRTDFFSAREAMERDFLKVELPSDHYLLTFSDEELAEILGKSVEWSPFDVAHARRLAAERGIDPANIEKQTEERMQKLQEGKPASETLLAVGWVSSALTGLIGVGIAWSICYMKDKTPEGDFYTYDEKSRKRAKPMFIFACCMLVIVLFIRIALFLED